jgi:hypothetical protein
VNGPSGPIRVFGDDTFVVEFVGSAPIAFHLVAPNEGLRHGTCEPFIKNAKFDDGTIPESTDLRVLELAFGMWIGFNRAKLP